MQDRDQLIIEWNNVQKVLKEARERESLLRKQLLSMLFNGVSKGTHRVQLGNGYALKSSVSPRYKVTCDNNEVLSYLGQLPAPTQHAIIKWKPEISSSAYDKLTVEERYIVNKFISIEQGSPSLELEVPKKANNV